MLVVKDFLFLEGIFGTSRNNENHRSYTAKKNMSAVLANACDFNRQRESVRWTSNT